MNGGKQGARSIGTLLSAPVRAQQVSVEEARATAKEAYVYAYAMLENY